MDKVGSCQVWGVLNVTPDSFSDGGLFLDPAEALSRAREMVREGADVIDVGGESTRPPGKTYGSGALKVEAAEELRRVVPVVQALCAEGIRVSVDTVKPEVAQAALDAGAAIVNDTSCGASRCLLEEVARAGAELVLMHNRGRGERSGQNVAYGDVVEEVLAELGSAVESACAAGVERGAIWLDPGVGFSKTASQSAALIAGTPRLVASGHRVLVGASRKSFIAELAPRGDGEPCRPEERIGGSAAAVTMAVALGCHAVRVHDVVAMREAALLTPHLCPGPRGAFATGGAP